MDAKSTEVSVGAHRISVTVFGSGEPAVVIEPDTTSIRDVLHSVRSGTLWPEWRLAGPRSRRRPGRLDRARNVNVTRQQFFVSSDGGGGWSSSSCR
jgi:hypothetical protein